MTINGVKVTDQDIDDIMSTALEGAITYWCDEAKVSGDYLGKYTSDQISRGGMVLLHEEEEDCWHTLTKEKLINGIRLWLEDTREDFEPTCVDEDGAQRLDTGCIDAFEADVIIQCALFDEIIFG